LDFLLSLLGFGFGILAGSFVGGQLILGLLYGVPMSAWYWLKGEIRFTALLISLAGPMFWVVALVALGAVLSVIAPGVLAFLVGNPGSQIGQAFATVGVLWSLVSPKGRRDNFSDWVQLASRHAVPGSRIERLGQLQQEIAEGRHLQPQETWGES
jgi:hypothetical protein